MTHIRRGLFAGLLAGLLLAMLNFVTDGTPGRTLPDALHWFGITIADPTLSRFAGFFVLIVLGGIVGIIFGLVQGERFISISRALLSGLVLGFAWWLVFSLLLTNIMNHASSPTQPSVWNVPCHFSHRFALRVGVGGNLLSTTGATSNGRSVTEILPVNQLSLINAGVPCTPAFIILHMFAQFGML